MFVFFLVPVNAHEASETTENRIIGGGRLVVDKLFRHSKIKSEGVVRHIPEYIIDTNWVWGDNSSSYMLSRLHVRFW